MNRFSGGLLRSPTNMNPWNFIDTFHVALWTISSGTVLILKCPFRYKGNKDSRGYFYKLSLFTQRINNQTISNWERSLLGLEDVRGNKWIFFKSSLKPVSKTKQSLFFFFFGGRVFTSGQVVSVYDFSSVQLLSPVWLFVTPWTTECQAYNFFANRVYPQHFEEMTPDSQKY